MDLLQYLLSPPKSELEEFLDGVVFSPEGTSLPAAHAGLLGSHALDGTDSAPLSPLLSAFASAEKVEDDSPTPPINEHVGNHSNSKNNDASAPVVPAEAQSKLPKSPTNEHLKPNNERNDIERTLALSAEAQSNPAEERQASIALPSKQASSEKNGGNEPELALPAEEKAKPAGKQPSKTPSDESTDDEPTLVLRTELQPNDVLCLRSTGGAKHPANVTFRSLVAARKEHFDSLSTLESRDYATALWRELAAAGWRFLRPMARERYQVLDEGGCVRKCHKALRRGDRAGISEKRQTRVTRPPKKKQKRGQEPLPELMFNDVAMAAISELLGQSELAKAVENWGEDKEKRRLVFEQNLLLRYQAAALIGMSVREFSERILPVLLEGIGVEDKTTVS